MDGLDLDNIDLENNDEFSWRIMEVYRWRYREWVRNNEGGRVRGSGISLRSYNIEGVRLRSRMVIGVVMMMREGLWLVSRYMVYLWVLS